MKYPPSKEDEMDKLLEGIRYLREKEYQKALTCFNKLIKMNAKSGEAYFWRAKTYEEVKDIYVKNRNELGKDASIYKLMPPPSEDKLSVINKQILNDYRMALKFSSNLDEIFSEFTQFIATNPYFENLLDIDFVEEYIDKSIGTFFEWYVIGEFILSHFYFEDFENYNELAKKCFKKVIALIKGVVELKKSKIMLPLENVTHEIMLIKPDSIKGYEKKILVNSLFYAAVLMVCPGYFYEGITKREALNNFGEYCEIVLNCLNLLDDKKLIIEYLLSELYGLLKSIYFLYKEQQKEEIERGKEDPVMKYSNSFQCVSPPYNLENDKILEQNKTISEFRFKMIEFIIDKLKRCYGMNYYWSKGVPEECRSKAEKLAIEKENKYPNRDRIEPYLMLEIRDFAYIITMDSNWKNIFESIFKNKRWIEKRIHKIADFRNEIKHDHYLGESEWLELQGLIKGVYECIKNC